jgi:hypothetical protein
MKTLLFAFCFLCSTGALAQNLLDATAHKLEMTEHPLRASQHTMAGEQTLLGQNSPFTFGQGERPLWEFTSNAPVEPLGDLAREIKKEHEAVKKSESVWVNY